MFIDRQRERERWGKKRESMNSKSVWFHLLKEECLLLKKTRLTKFDDMIASLSMHYFEATLDDSQSKPSYKPLPDVAHVA